MKQRCVSLFYDLKNKCLFFENEINLAFSLHLLRKIHLRKFPGKTRTTIESKQYFEIFFPVTAWPRVTFHFIHIFLRKNDRFTKTQIAWLVGLFHISFIRYTHIFRICYIYLYFL